MISRDCSYLTRTVIRENLIQFKLTYHIPPPNKLAYRSSTINQIKQGLLYWTAHLIVDLPVKISLQSLTMDMHEPIAAARGFTVQWPLPYILDWFTRMVWPTSDHLSPKRWIDGESGGDGGGWGGSGDGMEIYRVTQKKRAPTSDARHFLSYRSN